MKGSEAFKTTIQNHLQEVAKNDSLFAETLANPEKNIDDCITYILNQVQKSGCNGFEDSEIYNMAIHYYDEANIEVGKAVNAKVVVNHVVEITEEEKADAKKKALDQLIEQQKSKIQNKKIVKTAKQADAKPTEQTSLF